MADLTQTVERLRDAIGAISKARAAHDLDALLRGVDVVVSTAPALLSAAEENARMREALVVAIARYKSQYGSAAGGDTGRERKMMEDALTGSRT